MLLFSGGACRGWHRNACEGCGPRVTQNREAEGHTEHHPWPLLDEIDLTHQRLLIVNDRSSTQPGLSEKRDFRVLKVRQVPELCHHSSGGFSPMAREGLQELQGYMVSAQQS